MASSLNTDGLTQRPIPVRAGVGLKAQHYGEILETSPDIGWFEVHTENYMGAGGPPHQYLEAIAARYPLSFHGVGLSLGSADGLDPAHLKRKKELVDKYRPALVSEHLSWSSFGGNYLNDLLPLPYTQETLEVIADHLRQTQDTLGRQILIENPSTYLQYEDSVIPETDFLIMLAELSECGVLLDVNNIYVSAWNHRFDPRTYMNELKDAPVHEMHLAGHHFNTEIIQDFPQSRGLRIDDHGSPVMKDVWALYEEAIALFGPTPTLIEWDTNIPGLSVLMGEGQKAEAVMSKIGGKRHAAA